MVFFSSDVWVYLHGHLHFGGFPGVVPDWHQHGTGGTRYEYIIISSLSLHLISLLYPGKHLVWRLLCDWLCPYVDCALLSIKCGRL